MDVSAPVVIKLGKKSRKAIKQLKQGEGPLVQEIADIMDETRTRLGNDAIGKRTLVPVVMTYRRKPKSALSGLGGC